MFLHQLSSQFFISLSSFSVCSCAPCWIILDTLLLYFWCGDRLAGTTFISLKCTSVIFVKTSHAATSTNTATFSSNPASAAWPTVAQKEPRNCALHKQAVGLTIGIVLAVNPSRWILPVLLPPLMGNEVGPHPGRIRTKSLNDAHCVRRPSLWQTLWLLRIMVPARLQKVTQMMIKGVYHECFVVTYRINFEYFQKPAQAFHRRSTGLGSVYKTQPDICIFHSFPKKKPVSSILSFWELNEFKRGVLIASSSRLVHLSLLPFRACNFLPFFL